MKHLYCDPSSFEAEMHHIRVDLIFVLLYAGRRGGGKEDLKN